MTLICENKDFCKRLKIKGKTCNHAVPHYKNPFCSDYPCPHEEKVVSCIPFEEYNNKKDFFKEEEFEI